MIDTPEKEAFWEKLFREQEEEARLRDEGIPQKLAEPFEFPDWNWERVEHLRPKQASGIETEGIPEHLQQLFAPRARRVPYTGPYRRTAAEDQPRDVSEMKVIMGT